MSEPDQTIRALGGLALPDRTAGAAAVLVDDMFDILERLVAAQRRFARATLAPAEAAAVDVALLLPSDPADDTSGVEDSEGAPDASDDGQGADEGTDAEDDGASIPVADVDTDGDTLAGQPDADEAVVGDAVTGEESGLGWTTEDGDDDAAEDTTEDAEEDSVESDDEDSDGEPEDASDDDADSDDDSGEEPDDAEDSDAEDSDAEDDTDEDEDPDDAQDDTEVDAATTLVTQAGVSEDEDTGSDAPDETPEPAPRERTRRTRTEARSTTGTRTRRPEGERPRRSSSDVIRPDDEGAARSAPRRSTTGRPARRRSAE